MDSYAKEAEARWGESSEFQESKLRTSKYKTEDFQAAKVDQEAVTERFATAFGNSVDFKSVEVREIVQAHRAAISKWFYDCSVDMQKQLASLYISDDRFKKYYDGRVRGLSQYVHDAILAQ